jgi:hypothetical protein
MFVTIASNTINVNPSLIELPNDIGDHAITVTVSSLNYAGSGIRRQTYTLKVIVVCNITSFTFDTTINDIVYYIGSGQVTTDSFVISQNSDCKYAVTYEPITFYLNG